MDAAAVLSNGVLAFIEKFDVSILLNLQIGTFLYSESVLYSVEYMSLVSSVLVSVTQNISTEYVKSSSIIFFSPKLFSAASAVTAATVISAQQLVSSLSDAVSGASNELT